MWRLPRPAKPRNDCRHYASTEWVESKVMKGVRFQIARVSFMGRIELLKRLRTLLAELECRSAGADDVNRVESARLGLEVQKTYLEWGLAAVEGLKIDGMPATKESLLAVGPESLCEEIARSVRERSFLSEDERKN
jgi:hypothetical protein